MAQKMQVAPTLCRVIFLVNLGGRMKRNAEIRLLIEIKPPTEDFPYWEAIYPEIDLATQGETQQIAWKNAVEALRMWLSSLVEDGILDDVLRDCGFSANRIREIEEDTKYFLPQFVQENTQCRA